MDFRASELRGLRWQDVDSKKSELHVHQRADAYNQIGPPKSEAGERTVPGAADDLEYAARMENGMSEAEGIRTPALCVSQRRGKR